ncbi:MAG: ACP S-malonyltransferase [Candidatus Bipolaricaulota bacterium]|nr:MAG: ACP S-malonyltransferase [Candidatus Bipolaricaulota bacterium]
MAANTAFLFPGQGTVPEALPEDAYGRDLVRRAEERGVPLRERVAAGDALALRSTEIAQPLIFIDSVAKLAALRGLGIEPVATAGHSLGEYAALVCAGVLDAHAGLDLVIERGRAMAAVSGAMAAVVKLTLSEVEAICAEVGDEVTVANVNGERQIVVSGTEEAVASVADAAVAGGGRAFPLAVSGPFHTPLMRGASTRFAATLEAIPFREPDVTFVSAVSGAEERGGDRLKSLMTEQMLACVRWLDVMQRLGDAGIERAVEVGPGRVLIGLGSRILPELPIMTYEEAIADHG